MLDPTLGPAPGGGGALGAANVGVDESRAREDHVA